MGIEIERKFLMYSEEAAKRYLDKSHRSDDITQGYLTTDHETTVRVRTVHSEEDYKGYITVKGSTVGITRSEFEYEIPYKEAKEMLRLCKNTISKTRSYHVQHLFGVSYGLLIVELDVFHDKLEGLVLAEIELESEDENIDDLINDNCFVLEVTSDYKFSNVALAETTYNELQIKFK
jgi:CYTH domain-containing protein